MNYLPNEKKVLNGHWRSYSLRIDWLASVIEESRFANNAKVIISEATSIKPNRSFGDALQ